MYLSCIYLLFYGELSGLGQRQAVRRNSLTCQQARPETMQKGLVSLTHQFSDILRMASSASRSWRGTFACVCRWTTSCFCCVQARQGLRSQVGRSGCIETGIPRCPRGISCQLVELASPCDPLSHGGWQLPAGSVGT